MLVLGLVLFSFGLIKYSPATPRMCLCVDSCHQHSVYVWSHMVGWYKPPYVVRSDQIGTQSLQHSISPPTQEIGTCTYMVLMGLPHMVLILKLMLSFGAISLRMFVMQLALPQIKIHQKFACLHDWVNGLFFWSTVYVVGNFFQRHRTSGIDVCMTWPTQVVD